MLRTVLKFDSREQLNGNYWIKWLWRIIVHYLVYSSCTAIFSYIYVASLFLSYWTRSVNYTIRNIDPVNEFLENLSFWEKLKVILFLCVHFDNTISYLHAFASLNTKYPLTPPLLCTFTFFKNQKCGNSSFHTWVVITRFGNWNLHISVFKVMLFKVKRRLCFFGIFLNCM